MRLLPSYFLLPLLFLIPNAVIIISKCILKTTSHFKFLGKDINCLLILIMQFYEFCTFSVIHYWIYRLWVDKLRLPSFPLNMFFIGFYFFSLLLVVYDYENTRHNMQMVIYSTLKAYVFGIGGNIFSEPIYQLKGGTGFGGNMAVIVSTMKDGPMFWGSMVIIVLVFIAGLITLCITHRSLVFDSLYRKAENLRDDSYDLNKDLLEKEVEKKTGKAQRGWRKKPNPEYNIEDFMYIPDPPYLNAFFITTHLCAAIYIIIMTTVMYGSFANRLKFQSVIPYFDSLVMMTNHFEKSLPKDIKQNIVPRTRNYLPEGRYWLDDRNDIEYPMVHADRTIYCAYHPTNHDMCDMPPTPTPEPIKELPNIVLLTYESFNPSTYLINDDFINEHVKIGPSDPNYYVTNTTFYNSKVMPTLANLSRQGITFAGMNSHGMPTFSGWHSLMTGVIPSQSYMNIIDGTKLHVDDLPSHLRGEGYRSFFLSAQPFDFDGMRNWVYRKPAREEALNRLKCKEAYQELIDDPTQIALSKEMKIKLRDCTEKEIKKETKKHLTKSFPQWFDYLGYYYPTVEQAKFLNISEDSLAYQGWTNDRISSRQFQVHWKQQREIMNKKGIKQPIFGTAISCEAHMPYDGYDLERFYDPIDPKLKYTSNSHKVARFKRVNHYADIHYINETVEFLKQYDPNTIVILTGDHGTRDVPIRSKNSPITDQAVFSGDCVGRTSGTDSFFGVSGMITYLGDDPKIKEIMGLDKLAGKTLKMATDHNDLTYTVMDLLARMKAKPLMPTHKRGRNLVDLGKKVIELGPEKTSKYLDETEWQSISYLSLQVDYRKGSKYLRTHPSDVEGAHYYEHMSFPSCLKLKGAPDSPVGTAEAKEMFNEMFQFLLTENYLMAHNKVYHYNFRDEACVANRTCTLPTPQDFSIEFFTFYVAMVLVPGVIMVIASLVVLPAFYIADIVKMKQETDDKNIEVSKIDEGVISDTIYSVEAQNSDANEVDDIKPEA